MGRMNVSTGVIKSKHQTEKSNESNGESHRIRQKNECFSPAHIFEPFNIVYNILMSTSILKIKI